MTLENPRRIVHVISHGPYCLDGVASAVAVARYYAGDVVTPYFCNHREVNTVLAGLQCDPPEASHEVWITDIAWSEPAVDAHLQHLIDRGVKVYLIDHHRTTLQRFRAGAFTVRLTDSVLDESYAASRLVYEYLRQRGPARDGNDRFEDLQRLIAMADDNDRWLHRIAGSRDLAATVAALESRAAFDELLAVDAGVTYTPRMTAALERSRTERAHSFAVAEQSRVERPLPGAGLTLVAAVCNGHSSEIADAWGKATTGTVFALFDAKSLTVSLRRSPDCTVDLSQVAARLGGGGHPAAAGCELSELRQQLAQALVDTVAREIPS